MGIQERLKQFLQGEGLTFKQFEIVCGLGNGTAARIGENTRETILNRISNAFPELNTDWLMTGKGEMVRPEAAEQKVGDVRDSSLKDVNVIKGDPEAYRTISRMIEQQRQAADGYQRTIDKQLQQIDRLITILEKRT